MQDVETELADLDLIAFLEPAVGREIAHAGHAEPRAAGHDIVEQKLVGDMRTFDRHFQRVAQIRGAADMVNMAMGQPDFFHGDAGLLDRGQNLGNVAAGIDHDRLFGRLVPDNGAILLERRHRNDNRAGLCLGVGFVIHGATIFSPDRSSTRARECRATQSAMTSPRFVTPLYPFV